MTERNKRQNLELALLRLIQHISKAEVEAYSEYINLGTPIEQTSIVCFTRDMLMNKLLRMYPDDAIIEKVDPVKFFQVFHDIFVKQLDESVRILYEEQRQRITR